MQDLMQARFEAVKQTLARVRAIAPNPAIDRATLERIQPLLIELASRTELFPRESFGAGNGNSGIIYELSVDRDLRYALYASAGVPGKFAPPHNHTTWAAISGVYGDEHNTAYVRHGDNPAQHTARLEKSWELTCRKGNAVGFMPDDFHTIEVVSKEPALHLHLYGRSLGHLPDRVYFKEVAGGTYQRFMARPVFQSPYVSAAELRVMLADGGELAVIDVREGGVFARSHLLVASNIPLSVLELRAPDLLPRRDVRIVLVDDDHGLAQRAAAVLRRHGYLNLAVLEGGTPAWGAAGFELFSGTFVPSKAFGEYVEHEDDTARIEPQQLKAWQEEGRDLLIVDSRPQDEYKAMSIPGAMDCPGAELVYRVPGLLKSEKTTVVVNCAGRTRSIIGAQSLRNAGIANPVVALKNGTMGWHLAGFEVARGKTNLAPAPDPEGLVIAKSLAADVARRYGVPFISEEELDGFRLDDERTTYIFDVRLPEDFNGGHREDSLNAPGGQLVQATDTFCAVRNARIVLVDRDGVQAVMTAHWLKQMGWPDVYVLKDGLAGPLVTGKGIREPLGLAALSAPAVSAQELHAQVQAGGVEVIDVDSSLKYRKSRIPGSWYGLRSRLKDCLARFASGTRMVFSSSNGVLARYAAEDARAMGFEAAYLEGGTAAWRHAGYPMEAASGDDDPKFLTATEDVWYRPYDRNSGVEQAMQQYLTWEVNLLAQLEREPYIRFTTVPGASSQ
jgi:rhodanese-related sulfurtransferase/predicted metal-dependent enzyme (double-stranded beta helix superfamily)